MHDSSTQNIAGERRVTHSVEWKINVGYAILGVGLLIIAYLVATRYDAIGGVR